MLKIALRPKWIALFLFAIALASVFVILSHWQFSRSSERESEPQARTETVRPLSAVFTPGNVLLGYQADQMVRFEGEFTGDQVVISSRRQAGADGFWVVESVWVDGSSPRSVIPVVLGWTSDLNAVPVPARGTVSITGRLLPSEAPQANHNPDGPRPSLSTADLANVWEKPIYAAFIANATFRPNLPSSSLEPVQVGPQPQGGGFNWLNIFYAVEWVVFAGFALFLWWRLVADEYKREQEEKYDADPELANKLITK